jgi:hypothetical protein
MRPEQTRAIQYLGERGTRAPLAAIRQGVADAFAAFEAAVAPVAAEPARARPFPGEWTVHEVVDHLVETHRPSITELRDLLAGHAPAAPPIPAGLQSADPLARPWDGLCAELRALHAETLAVLDGAREDVPLTVRAPIVMVVNVGEPDGRRMPLHWEEALDWKAYAIVFRLHVLDHLGQVRRLLAAARR